MRIRDLLPALSVAAMAFQPASTTQARRVRHLAIKAITATRMPRATAPPAPATAHIEMSTQMRAALWVAHQPRYSLSEPYLS